MSMTTHDDERSAMIGEILYLARTRVHRIDQRQLDALQTQTMASITAMHRYLSGRPADQAVAAQAQDSRKPGISPVATQVGRATRAALTAAAGARSARAERAPEADKVQAEGYVLHDGKLYKVQRAIYGSGNLYAKRLDLDAGEFIIAKGMMAYLRESERITEDQAIKFGQSLEITPEMGIYGKCLICGRPLTDEESIRNKVGPGPHKGL
jgi:hypothetical protein